jgi:hypothetical protein
MLNDRTCILCGFKDSDIIETQRQNEEFRDCPSCGQPSFRRQVQYPATVSLFAGRAIDAIDAERAKCALGHGNTSLRF